METIALIASLSGLFIAGANLMIFCIIKFNDLSHISKDMLEIKKTLGDIWVKLNDTTERIAKLEGKCKANHG